MRSLPTAVAVLASGQDGVVSRRQLLELGAGDGDIRAWRGARLLTSVVDGVYVDHTGVLTWRQRAWAAVLALWPSVLAGPSTLAVDGLSRSVGRDGPIHVAVDAHRTVTAPPGVVVRRVAGLTDRARWHLSPPRDRVEQAVLDVAAAATDDLRAVAVLAEAVSSHRTTPPRLLEALANRTRIARRPLLHSVIEDLAAGACSVLERAYLHHVERAHGLPTGDRQVRASCRGVAYRDVEYAAYGVVIELDGRADHTAFDDRDRDLDRDLDAVVDGRVTARLGWGQVLGRMCLTAERVGRLLQRRGWTGEIRRCPHCPDRAAPDDVGSQRPGR